MSGARDESAATVIAVGDELLAGRIADTNSGSIARLLGLHGRRLVRVVVTGDGEQELADSIREAARRCSLVFTTGGLGPTLDDVTRHAAARAAGTELELDAAALTQLREYWQSQGREMPASNERQALIPRGATLLENDLGTAPGFRMAIGQATLFALPGPPRELAGMLARHVAPWATDHAPGERVYTTRYLHLFGLSESALADSAGEWMARDANPLMGVTFRSGTLSLSITGSGSGAADALARVEAAAARVRERFGEHLFSETHDDVAQVLGELAIERGLSLTIAESCTGGLVAARLTEVPGISAVFRESFVTYSDRAKIERLGVPRELLEQHGAVSREVAEAMARGAAESAGARLAVSVTGIAGPGGGSPEKPVGTVAFGLAVDGALSSHQRQFPAVGRDRIRDWSASTALMSLLRAAREV